MTTVANETTAQSRTEAFVDRYLEFINGAGMAMMISIGHRTCLFDCMSKMEPATSPEIAAMAGLQERYVREWLNAMVAGQIVHYDAQEETYQLPTEHAAVLTRNATPDNLAVTAQFIACLGGVETQVVECFRDGGGVDYSQFERFHEVMREESDQTVCGALLDHIIPLVDGLGDRLRFGANVMDVGCGSGHAMMLLAEAFPESRFRGTDVSREAITYATSEAKRRGLANVVFDVRDAADIELREHYDLVTAFDAIHDQRDPGAVLATIHRALKPTGLFLMQDIDASSHVEKNLDHPLGAFLYTISCMHCMTVSLAQCGAGLGTCWGVEKAESMCRVAGFDQVDVHRLPHDIMNAIFICRM